MASDCVVAVQIHGSGFAVRAFSFHFQAINILLKFITNLVLYITKRNLFLEKIADSGCKKLPFCFLDGQKTINLSG